MSEPVFDASTLSALTKKIQHGLKSGENPGKNATVRGGDRGATNGAHSKGQQKQRQEQQEKGRKRTRDGKEKNRVTEPATKTYESKKIVPSQASAQSSGPRASAQKPRPAPSAKDTNGKPKKVFTGLDLRQIVSELGGDDDDLKLIEDVGSESEVEGQSGEVQPALKNDLQRMIKELGFSAAMAQDVDTDDEAEESADDEVEGEDDAPGEDDAAALDFEEYDQGEDEEDNGESSELIAKAKQALEKLPLKSKPNANGLIIEPQSEWHTIQLPGIAASTKPITDITTEGISRLHGYAKQLLQEENDRYAKTNRSVNPANQFYSTIMASGTLSDKISALTLSVQESPIHNVGTLENLLNMAKKRNRGQAVDTLSALKDLLGPGSLLPSDRRLRNFSAQPALKFVNGKNLDSFDSTRPIPKPLTKAHLIVWAYEDWLKAIYFEMLKVLEVWCVDEIPYSRQKAVGYIYELLRDKPEQEANLLRLLVNKLGDTDKKIASKASYYIMQIENHHPAMKPLITAAIENDFLFKPHQSNHAKYYAIITLNQTVLSAKEEPVARQLLGIYFALFITLLKKSTEPVKPVKSTTKLNSKGQVQGGGSAPGKKAQKKAANEDKSVSADEELKDKMLSGVLTGVNRALPYVDKSSDFFEKHLDTLFRVTHSANFNTSVQALMLIQQLCGSHQAASNRFYRTLYESLLDPRVLTSSKQALYLNLLYRALRSDLNVKRIKAFVKRMLQTTAMHQPSFACAVIYLIRELEGVFPGLANFIDQPEADDSDDEAEETMRSQRYDGRKRDPEHAAAETSSLWELAPLQTHFHPSVSIFASNLLKHDEMPSKPDLNTNTLIQFLDRFVYRNPKKTTTGLKGQSIMQPLAAGDASSLLVTAKGKASGAMRPLNTEGFRAKATHDVAPDEVFFHRYFNEIGKKSDKAKKKKEDKKRKDGEEDDLEDENEDEIWQALVESRPEIEGGDDEDDDLDLDDLDDLEDEMEDIEGDEDIGEDKDEVGPQDSMDEDDSEGAFDFDEEDALLGSDDELPDGMEMLAAPPTAIGAEEDSGSRKKNANKRRKMLRSLPMFASADDYAKMLEDEEDS